MQAHDELIDCDEGGSAINVSELHILLARKNAEVENLRKSLASWQASAPVPATLRGHDTSEDDVASKAAECAPLPAECYALRPDVWRCLLHVHSGHSLQTHASFCELPAMWT